MGERLLSFGHQPTQGAVRMPSKSSQEIFPETCSRRSLHCGGGCLDRCQANSSKVVDERRCLRQSHTRAFYLTPTFAGGSGLAAAGAVNNVDAEVMEASDIKPVAPLPASL